MMASYNGCLAVAKVLVEKHADISKVNKKLVSLGIKLSHLLENLILRFRGSYNTLYTLYKTSNNLNCALKRFNYLTNM